MSLLKNIENIKIDDVKWLSLEDQFIKCKCVDVYDGDTITLIFPFLDSFFKKKCRLDGIDCAEIRTKDLIEKKFGLETKSILQDKILNKIIYVKCGKDDKYGRTLITIFLTENDMKNNINSINTYLINIGKAYTYNGKTKKKFNEWKIL